MVRFRATQQFDVVELKDTNDSITTILQKNSVYTNDQFRRSFQIVGCSLFLIQAVVEAHDAYFVQRRDCIGRLGLSSLQKFTAAMRMLAYGVAADAVDNYVRISEST